MSFPALPDLAAPQEQLQSIRERLVTLKASLQKVCADLEVQIQALDALEPTIHLENTLPGLFESEPVPPLMSSPPPMVWQQPPVSSVILEASIPTSVSPELEQATLEELNSALSKAFAQISGHRNWAG